MNAILKQLLERAETWSKEDQEELAQVVLEIEARRSGGVYHATQEELRAIDEGIAAAERGEFATEAEVETILNKYR